MFFIGSYIWKDLSDMIIKDYLSTAVPYMNTQVGGENKTCIVFRFHPFRLYLVQWSIRAAGFLQLLIWSPSFEVCWLKASSYFGNKFCRRYFSGFLGLSEGCLSQGKNGHSNICRRQPLTNLKSVEADHLTSNFLKAISHKFFMLHSWIPWPICKCQLLDEFM